MADYVFDFDKYHSTDVEHLTRKGHRFLCPICYGVLHFDSGEVARDHNFLEVMICDNRHVAYGVISCSFGRTGDATDDMAAWCEKFRADLGRKLEKALASNDESSKVEVIDEAKRFRLCELLPQIVPLLDSSEPLPVRRAAAHAVSVMADARYYDVYIRHLQSPDWDIASQMVLALGVHLQFKEAVPVLLETFETAQHPKVRRSALRSLVEIGDPRAIPAIRKGLGTAGDDPLREHYEKVLRELEAVETSPDARP